MTASSAVKFAPAIFLVCATLLAPGWAQNVLDQSNVVSSCAEDQFKCQNGECIQRGLLCDGRADCTDQSDETQLECTKPELTCPDYAFRCLYGACVSKESICNGARDCIDNSDETLPRCPSGIASTHSEDRCDSAEYRCMDGQCIESGALCDGAIDCVDGSDETFVICGSFPCSQSLFRCNYGACIDSSLRCDNVSHCGDGSDEDPLLCGRSGSRPTVLKPQTPPPQPTPKPTPTIRPTIPNKPAALLCPTPEQPTNGRWRVHKSLCGGITDGTTDCEYAPGIEFEPGTPIVYSCAPGYTIRGAPVVYCGRDGSWSKTPVCTKITCSRLNSPSTSASCSSRTLGRVNCDSEVLPGTSARVSCLPGYRKDSHSTPTQGDVLYCNDAGRWEPEPIRCIPACGHASSRTTPLSVNGVTASITDFPWHATLYVEKKTSGKKEFQCGGTIIQPDVVLTAAHCVYDENTMKSIDAKKLFIATGNTFRDYDFDHNYLVVKKSAVKNVYRHCQYYGLSGKYASDIALLELQEPFILSELLLPACLDITGERNYLLDPQSYGKVAGFGRTALADSSAILQTVTLPYVPYNQCKAATNSSDEVTLIGTDKFCAGWTNGSAVCEGDSGGGLVFQEPGGLWYVMGIVSTSLGVNIDNGEVKCNHFTYSLYTRVSSHMGWIQNILIQLKQNQPVHSCK